MGVSINPSTRPVRRWRWENTDDEIKAAQGFKSTRKDLSDAKRMGARESTQAEFQESNRAPSLNTCASFLYKLSYNSSVIVGATVSHQEDVTCFGSQQESRPRIYQ